MNLGDNSTHSREQILSFALKAEQLGYDSLSVNDHIVFNTSWLDAVATLSAVAGTTSKIKLGTSILNIVIRNPIVAARTLSSIDILSSGRLFAGVGPGSSRMDYDVCGIPYEDRWKRFTEALQVINMLWNKNNDMELEEDGKNSSTSQLVNFGGRYYQFKGLSREPRPIQRPHPPIYIGSWGSSDAGLRRVAKYGDGWMASAYNITEDKFKEKWDTIRSYRKDFGKDLESFDNALMSMFGYIDDDSENVHKMAENILSPSLGRSAKELESRLLFGSVHDCIQKINAIYEAGVKRIHFWPIHDFNKQIEIFSKEIASRFSSQYFR
jgi:alkanesulfonate monooxygenase SsuD/methylene tetrahydromethanopterin reductase-like flavin-dependent oxidoreductase (luciferase family)